MRFAAFNHKKRVFKTTFRAVVGADGRFNEGNDGAGAVYVGVAAAAASASSRSRASSAFSSSSSSS